MEVASSQRQVTAVQVRAAQTLRPVGNDDAVRGAADGVLRQADIGREHPDDDVGAGGAGRGRDHRIAVEIRDAGQIGREAGEWDRYSPGRLMIEDLIGWCNARGGVTVFDLTAGEEGYKREWTDHSLPLFEYLAPLTLAGALFTGQHHIREWLKQNRQLRNSIRRLRGRCA